MVHEFHIPLDNPVLIFALILFIILLCPIFLHKIKVPSIIGLIISGVLIGPYGLHIVDNDSAIKLFSTIGLLYIMFIAGLELDMNEFSKNKNKSIIYSLLNFIAPPLLGFPLCYWGLGYSVTASMLLSCMLMTHTLVSYPIVSRMGITKDKSVIVTVGGTVLTDTVVLILLAVVMEIDKGITWQFMGQLFIALVIYLGAMFWTIPRLSQWFFKKMANEGYAMYVYVLLVVFVASFCAEIAGLEPIIGAFIAGLSINRQIPHSSVLMNRIEFVGNSIFIPFFLISVGMLVDIRAIMTGADTILLTIGLTAVAIVSKWLVAYFAQRLFNYTIGQRNLIFGLSSAHAAATLAIILVGYRAGVLDETALNATIILILITCVIASFVTENAAKEVAIQLHNDDDIDMHRYSQQNQHILLPIANMETLNSLMEVALLLKNKKSKNSISLMSVVPNDEQAEINILKLRKKLSSAVGYTNAIETNVDLRATISHNIPSAITRIAREIIADTIILGWPRNLDMLDRFIGDTIDKIVYSTDKTTLICGLEANLLGHKKFLVICPRYSMYEEGFEQWVTIVSKLAQELSLSVELLCDSKSHESIQRVLQSHKINISLDFIESEHPEDLTQAKQLVRDEHLICLISSRKGYVSYNRGLEHLPVKIERTFPANSRLIIYPKQVDATTSEVITPVQMN
ncbi:MAG: cation:proton antiporter [Marinifilaceae bacterium]